MRCPVCTAEIQDLYPKPRCRRCGYIESCCQPEVPCSIVPSGDDPALKEPAPPVQSSPPRPADFI